MNKFNKLFLSTSILMVSSVIPFGNTAFASDCGAEYVEGVGECAEEFLDDSVAGSLIYLVCFVKEVVVWVICQIGNLL